MGQCANIKSYIHHYFNVFMAQLSEKIFKRKIFTTKNFDQYIITYERAIDELSKENQDKLYESLDEVSAISKNFELIKSKFLYGAKINVNMLYFKQYVKNYESGYYYVEAFILYFFRLLLLIIQLIITLRFYYPKFVCVKIPIGEQDKKFWLSNNQKFKVIELEENREFPLRFIIFIADAIFVICGFFVLINLQRIKAGVFYIIFIQITKLICILIIIIPDFSRSYLIMFK